MQAVFTAIGQFFTALLAKFTAVANWVLQLVTAIFTDLWEMARDAFSWLFDQVLDIAIMALGAIDLSGVQGISPGWSGLPGELLNVAGLLGLGQCLALIVSAALVRMALQLIPFVRLGS